MWTNQGRIAQNHTKYNVTRTSTATTGQRHDARPYPGSRLRSIMNTLISNRPPSHRTKLHSLSKEYTSGRGRRYAKILTKVKSEGEEYETSCIASDGFGRYPWFACMKCWMFSIGLTLVVGSIMAIRQLSGVKFRFCCLKVGWSVLLRAESLSGGVFVV